MPYKKSLMQLLASCIAIKEEINKKIPLVANRYPQFEQIERAKILDFVQLRTAQDLAAGKDVLQPSDYEAEFLKQNAQDYKNYKLLVNNTRTEYYVFKHVNTLFSEFLILNSCKNATQLTLKQQEDFKQQLLRKSRILCA